MEEPMSQPDGKLRCKTWSLTGLLAGMFLTSIPRGVENAHDLWVYSFIMGFSYMFVGLIAALALNKFLGPTKTLLPFYNGTARQNQFISIALVICVLLRSTVSASGFATILAAVVIHTVMRGNR